MYSTRKITFLVRLGYFLNYTFNDFNAHNMAYDIFLLALLEATKRRLGL